VGTHVDGVEGKGPLKKSVLLVYCFCRQETSSNIRLIGDRDDDKTGFPKALHGRAGLEVDLELGQSPR
jgi:hypothetical protein